MNANKQRARVSVGNKTFVYYLTGIGRKNAKGLERFNLMRSRINGQLLVNGSAASDLVNKYPGIEFSSSSIKPDHFSDEEIRKMVDVMKAAS